MQTVFCRGTAADLPAIIDFGNYVFSHAGDATDFPSLIPKLYGPGSDSGPYHYLLKEEGLIRAMACVQPLNLRVAGEPLQAACIGTVSVHPYARGRGYMKALMTRVTADLKAQGTAFACLGGQRQRYEYYGFTPTGVQTAFHLTAANLRHRYGSAGDWVTFWPLESPEDPLVREAFSLYEAQPVAGARTPETFCAVCRTWNMQPLAVQIDGAFAGYVCARGETVQELRLRRAADLPAVCAALMRREGVEALRVTLPLWEREAIAWFADVAEYGQTAPNSQFLLLDFPTVTRAFMRCRAALPPLADGRLVLDIAGTCRIKLTVQAGIPAVEETAEPPDVSLPPFEAARLLFSPLGGMPGLPVPPGWFPLPLYVPGLDAC